MADTVTAQHAQSPGLDPQHCINHTWWCTAVIPARRRQTQEDHKFKVLFEYVLSLKAAWAMRYQEGNGGGVET